MGGKMIKLWALVAVFLAVKENVVCQGESSSLRKSPPHSNDHERRQLQRDQACVTLLQYAHMDCHGAPTSVRNNTVWTAPGMPCKHTDRMGGNSVTDEHCTWSSSDNDADAQFHQKVFVKNTHCKVEWYQKAYSPMSLTYTEKSKGGCTYGYNIATCTRGPCENPSPPIKDDGEDGHEDFLLWDVSKQEEK